MKTRTENNRTLWLKIAAGVIVLAVGWSDVIGGGWGILLKVAGILPVLSGLAGLFPAPVPAVASINRRR